MPSWPMRAPSPNIEKPRMVLNRAMDWLVVAGSNSAE